MRATLRLLAVVVALASSAAAAQAAGQAPMKIRVIGFAAIFHNEDHVVHAKKGGVLRRCDEPGLDRRAFSVVLDVANVEGGLPYQTLWDRNGKRFHTGKKGTSGSFDAVPNRIAFGFRKARPLPDGDYVFRFVIDGKVRATGKVTRHCNA